MAVTLPQPNVPEQAMPWAREITRIVQELGGSQTRLATVSGALNRSVGSSTTAVKVVSEVSQEARIRAEEAKLTADIANEGAYAAAATAAAAEAAAAAAGIAAAVASADAFNAAVAAGDAKAYAVSVAKAAANKAINGGFENGFDSWTPSDPASQTITSLESRSGTSSLRVDASPNTRFVALNSQLKVFPGQSYGFTAWYKTTSDYNGTASNGKMRLGDQNGSFIAAITTGMSLDWASVYYELTLSTNSPVTGIQLTLSSDHTAGTIWFDDVEVKNITDIKNALATANGKNSVTYSANNATGSGTAVGDIWFKTASGIITGEWLWSGSAWVAHTLDSDVIANLDAGKITAGYISAARINTATLQGKTIQTASTGPRVVLDAAGLKGYSATSTIATSIGTNGLLTALNAVITGSLTTGAASTGQVIVDDDSATFKAPNGYAAIIKATNNGSTGRLMSLSAGSNTVYIGALSMPGPGSATLTTDSIYSGAITTDAQINNSTGTPMTGWGMAAGRTSMTMAASAGTQTTVTLPSGRFSVAPIITLTPGADAVYQTTRVISVWSKTATSFVAALSNSSGNSGTFIFEWLAVQMTKTTAAG